MTQGDHCQGVHMWYPLPNDSQHKLAPVACRDYVLALERLVTELGGSLEDAISSLMAGEGSDTRLNTAEQPHTGEPPQAALCSKCRERAPYNEHRWCLECIVSFRKAVGASVGDEGTGDAGP